MVTSPKTVLIAGASRGLGHAMAEQFLLHGWQVIGTVRDLSQTTPLHHLAEAYPGRVRIEALDICDSDGIAALRNALADSVLDMLFVNAGTTNRDPTQTIGEIATEEFIHVMLTNALAPMRVIENLQALVLPQGLIGVMSSGQGSLSNNTGGRSFAARPASVSHPMVVMAPGWIRTALGGESAPLTMAETIPSLVNVLLEKQNRPGLEYLDYRGYRVPW